MSLQKNSKKFGKANNLLFKKNNKMIKKLEWDSIFFGFNVFLLQTEKLDEINDIISNFNKSKSLIYLFTRHIILNNQQLKEFNGKLVDQKVILKKNLLKENIIKNKNIEIYKKLEPNNELYNLAKISGEYSRFKLDKRLPNFTFNKMYNLWIEKACIDENIIVFIYKHNNMIKGFLSLNIKDNDTVIELIAVDNDTQGKGIGKDLIMEAENYSIKKNINKISVATQKDNNIALSFYKKMNYNIDSITNIYHFINN